LAAAGLNDRRELARLGQGSGMTPEDVRPVMAGDDEFSVVGRSLPHRDP
jgi:hypothetical protein